MFEIASNEDSNEEQGSRMAINWLYLRTVIFTQALPSFISLIMTTYAFKFALDA